MIYSWRQDTAWQYQHYQRSRSRPKFHTIGCITELLLSPNEHSQKLQVDWMGKNHKDVNRLVFTAVPRSLWIYVPAISFHHPIWNLIRCSRRDPERELLFIATKIIQYSQPYKSSKKYNRLANKCKMLNVECVLSWMQRKAKLWWIYSVKVRRVYRMLVQNDVVIYGIPYFQVPFFHSGAFGFNPLPVFLVLERGGIIIMVLLCLSPPRMLVGVPALVMGGDTNANGKSDVGFE